MPKATILFADNDPDFLQTRSEFLEQEGYRVIRVAGPTEARRQLEAGGIDLAVLDIRLERDDDEHDTSGLTLAKEVARTVPKIILTGFPGYDYVREALRPQQDGLSVAVDFVAKKEGPEALLRAIRKALSPTIPRRAGKKNPWISGSFYLFAAVALTTLLAVISTKVPWYVLPLVIIGGLLIVVIVGAFTLRAEEGLSEAGFLRLMKEALKRLPLLGYKASNNSEPSDELGRKGADEDHSLR